MPLTDTPRSLASKLRNSPLARKTLLQMSIRLSVVITIAALVSYFHIFGILNEQIRDSLKKYISERGQKESSIFLNAERNHRLFSEQFLQQWPDRKHQPKPEGFSNLFVLREDSGRRLHHDAFKGIPRNDGTSSRHISGYIGSNAPQTTEFFNKLKLTYDLIDRYGDAWTMDYANLYVSMPDNVNIVYWPGVAWGDQAEATLDVTTEEWVYIANTENNPDRYPVWTGLYHDQTVDEWMVSLVTPVDQENEHLINIGHDILLNTLFERVFNDKLAGTYNFIFREDARIIAHPDLVDQLRDHRGILYANETNDSMIADMVNLILGSRDQFDRQSIILEAPTTDALLAVTKINGPNWFFVTVYPNTLLSSTALQTAYIVSIVGIISLIAELIILFFVLKGQVLEPIGTFQRFSKEMGEGRFESIEALSSSAAYYRQDEVGELAGTMVNMASTIREHEENLIGEVAEKTLELSRTNEDLVQESRSRKEIMALLQTIAKDVSGLQGNNYFSTLGEFLSHSLDGDFVIICRLSEDQQHLHSLAAYLGKKQINNISYPIVGTPCEIVINEGPQLYNGDVQALFPDDQDLVDMGLNSYIGTPMYDSSGKAIGHLAVLKREHFQKSEKVSLIIESVSTRASSELIRHVNEEIITRQASTDDLTGLANRAVFLDRLSQAIHRAQRRQSQLAVVFIDFDHFKLINDRLGHTEGDKLLQIFSARLNQCIRGEDTVARFGGDEFIILLNDVNGISGPEQVTRSIQKSIGKEIVLAGISLTQSCSMGVAIYPDDGTNIDVLVNHADTAMYQAKELGRNNVQFFAPFMNREIEQRREVEHDLQQAISKQEFIIHYQPIISLESDDVSKVEALVRWLHPEKGLINPDDFIPVAEQTGQIVSIGEFVLNQACLDLSVLKEHFQALQTVAVNYSARQFQDPDCADKVIGILNKHGISFDGLEIEITESLFINQEDHTSRKTLKQLHQQGIGITLDDFGTGYSSLAYLKRLPINCLKIDRSFIADALTDQESLALVHSIIDLAHNFNLKVVAEGVETLEQSQLLQESHCDLAQGYYYCRPQALEDLITMTEIHTLTGRS